VKWRSLYDLLAQEKLTHAELAEKMGCAERSIQAWLYGERAPTAIDFVLLSLTFGVHVSELMMSCPRLRQSVQKRMPRK
jgi:transcriptional regulator with XRE-family HTH domain